MFSPGQLFADYRIVRVLGAGGMGEVYLAQHPRLPREDALKVLPTALTDDPTYRARFIREADLASGLDHSSIVSVYDRGEDQGQLWITMKFIPGSDANALMKQTGPFAPRDVVEVVNAVADALDYAHGKGLLHRDVKPANILIDATSAANRKVYLTDFGIARTVGNNTALTGANLTVGSIQYTSPEQLRRDDLNGRTDQYSLACTAFKLLTGRAPYPERTPTEIINAHLNAPIPPARALRPELPPEVDAVLTRGMDKKAVNRYPTCVDFARDLAAALRISSASPRYPETMINPGPAFGPMGATPPPAAPPAPISPPRPAGPADGQAVGQQPHYPGTPQWGAQPPQPPGSYHPGMPQPPYGGPPWSPGGWTGANSTGSGDGRGKRVALVACGVLVVAALATGLAFGVNAVAGDDGDGDEAAAPTESTTAQRSSSAPVPSSNATDPAVVGGAPTQCVDGRAASNSSTTRLTAGKISIPTTEMPSGWNADRGTLYPFVTRADGVTLDRPPGSSSWVAQIGVGVLPTDFRGQTERIARKFVECLSTGPGYDTVSVGPVDYGRAANGNIENRDTAYTLLTASIPVRNGPAGVTGDDIIVAVVDSSPMTLAVGISPTGDTSTKRAVDKAVNGLLVRD